MSARSDEMRWYARLIKLAHELAMEGRGQEAQDLREAATHARNYRWLRDEEHRNVRVMALLFAAEFVELE